MTRSLLLIVLDGCEPCYLERAETPHLDGLESHGQSFQTNAAVPTVTNVNVTSLLTGSPPSRHGITGNTYLRAEDGALVPMNDRAQLLCPTLFGRAQEAGGTTAFLSAKRKLLSLFEPDLDYSLSVEEPPDWAVDAVGDSPDIYDREANLWLLEAAASLLRSQRPSLLVACTTDLVPHLHRPEDPAARDHFERIDALIGRLVELAPEAAIVVTADHSMRDKPQITDLRPCVEAFDGRVVPVIKDPYTLHHGNLGGAVYVHLERGDRAAEASTELLEMRGVDRVLTADEAHDEFALHADRVGHLVVLGDADTVFSYGEPARSSDALRSHGSLHERAVPVITTNLEPISAEYSWEVTAAAFEMTR